MKTKTTKLIGLGLAGGILILTALAATPPRRPAAQAFMRQKLVYSQGVMEGLALERFDLISQNAINLRRMTQSNLWYSIRQPDYMLRTTNYQIAVDGLYKAAIDRNLDAATEAFTKVSRSCVECHRVLRRDQRPPPR
jgi:hypothetical protein